MTPGGCRFFFLYCYLSYGRITWLFRVYFIDWCGYFVRFNWNYIVYLYNMTPVTLPLGTSWPLEAIGFFPCIIALVTDVSRDHFGVYFIDWCRYLVRFDWNYIVYLYNMTIVTLSLGTSWPLEAVGFFPCIVTVITDVSRDNFGVYFIDWCRYLVRFDWNYIVYLYDMTIVTLPLGTSWPLEAVGFFPCIVTLVTDVSRDNFGVYFIDWCRYLVRFDWNYIVYLYNMTVVTLPLGTSWPLEAVGFFPCIVTLVTDVSRDNIDVYYTYCGPYIVRFDWN